MNRQTSLKIVYNAACNDRVKKKRVESQERQKLRQFPKGSV